MSMYRRNIILTSDACWNIAPQSVGLAGDCRASSIVNNVWQVTRVCTDATLYWPLTHVGISLHSPLAWQVIVGLAPSSTMYGRWHEYVQTYNIILYWPLTHVGISLHSPLAWQVIVGLAPSSTMYGRWHEYVQTQHYTDLWHMLEYRSTVRWPGRWL